MNYVEALKSVDSRVFGLKIHDSESAELTRMQMIQSDLLKNMNAADINDARKLAKVLTKQEEKEESERISRAMNLNVDKPSH